MIQREVEESTRKLAASSSSRVKMWAVTAVVTQLEALLIAK